MHPVARFATWVTRVRWQILVPVAYGALTVAWFWPLVARIAVAVPDTEGDPLLNAWALRWDQHALLTDPLHIYDANQFAPNPHSLAFSDALLPQAILAWPVSLLTHDALFSQNFVALMTFPLCAAAMYALCRALNAARGAAFLAGMCYAFAPMRIESIAQLQVLSIEWMPLTLLAIIRFTQRRTPLRGLAVALSLAVCALSSAYWAVIFGVGLIALLAVEAIRFRRLYLSRGGVLLCGFLLAGLLVVAAVDAPYFAMQREQGVTRTLDEAYENAARTASYGTVPSGSLVWHRLLPASSIGNDALFPGAVALALALAGVGAIRRQWLGGLAALGIVGFVLSFGPTWGAKATGIPLPYRVLYTHLPAFAVIRGPVRFATLVLFALCVFAALGATRLYPVLRARCPAMIRGGIVSTLLCVGAIALDDGARLPPLVTIDQSATTLAPYQWLATQHDLGIVAEFPAGAMATRTAFYSIEHWYPVLWGHSGLIPEAQYALMKRLAGQHDALGPGDLDALSDLRVGTILVHQFGYSPEAYDRIHAQLAKAPTRAAFRGHIGDADIYQLIGAPTTPSPTITVRFSSVGAPPNGGELYGELQFRNDGPTNRLLYRVGRPTISAEIRDVQGTLVERAPLTVTIPALLPPGASSALFSLPLHRPAGTYTVTLVSDTLPILERQAPAALTIRPTHDIPRLTIHAPEVTSPALFVPHEAVAMWVTRENQASAPLADVRAAADGSIVVRLSDLPPDTVRIVAYGKESGVALWGTYAR